MQLVMNVALARTAAERYQSASEFGRDAMDAVAGMPLPETRVGMPHQGETHVMSAAEVSQATQHQAAAKKPAAKGAAAPAAPAKRLPLVPILGGVGAVGAIVVVAVFMMKGTKLTPSTPPAGQPVTQQGNVGGQSAAQPVPGNTQPGPTTATPGTSKRPAPTPNQPAPGNTPNNPPPTPAGGSMAAQIDDSLTAAVKAEQDGQNAVARRKARWVYYRDEATPSQKAEAAETFAISVNEADTAQVIEWARNGLRYASGARRARLSNIIQTYGGTP
jgi:hypothetical protein